MANQSDQTICFFCQRELSEGQGRYRFFQGDNQVECCPACFDETKILLRRMAEEPGAGRITSKAEKEFANQGS